MSYCDLPRKGRKLAVLPGRLETLSEMEFSLISSFALCLAFAPLVYSHQDAHEVRGYYHSLCSQQRGGAGEQLIEFTLKTCRLGRIMLPCRIGAVGSVLPPVEFVIAAKSVGPRLEFGPPGKRTSEMKAISFGRVTVLTTHTYTLPVHNPSLIAADVKAFIAGKSSVFSVATREAQLQVRVPASLAARPEGATRHMLPGERWRPCEQRPAAMSPHREASDALKGTTRSMPEAQPALESL